MFKVSFWEGTWMLCDDEAATRESFIIESIATLPMVWRIFRVRHTLGSAAASIYIPPPVQTCSNSS